ncbi:MAG: hypothetical protein SVV80_07840 [Planctomycetota bacterium]|nr:hypothetical protein [Planctomycetota bacterium]
MTENLEQELRTYEDHKADLLSKARGKFALIKDQEVCDVFETRNDAVRQGYERFGNVPFLVKEILEIETPQNFTSNLLGV